MQRFQTFALILVGSLLAGNSFAQTIDCDKGSNVNSINQKVREKTYQYIRLANDKSRKVNADSLLDLAKDYIDLQTSFNAVFTSMKESKGIFTSKKTICNRYSDTLTVLMNRANAYDDRILKLLKFSKPANFGVSDVLDIIDWVFKKYKEGKDNFYTKLAWADYDDVVKKTTGAKTVETDKGKKDAKDSQN
jgi:hypothetical protein